MMSLLSVFRQSSASSASPAIRGARPRARAAAIVAATLCVVAGAPATANAASPANDPFYAAPADLASLAPGDVIRSRPTSIMPIPGIKLPYKAYQVLYRTNDTLDQPVATVATIILPTKRPSTGRKLLSFQVAYDGLAPKCQTSYALRTGTYAEPAAESALIAGALAKGWTVVTADYEGPNNTWIAGKMAGHGVLDGIRAAERFAPAGLNGEATEVGMMGYSGGGHATAWANELASTYAPELNIKGATQGGVPAKLPLLLDSLNGGPFAGVLFAAIVGLKEAYPDVDFDRYLNNKGRSAFRKLRGQCITEFLLGYPFAKIKDYSTVPNILEVPEIKTVAEANNLGQHAPSVPTLMFHSRKDELVAYPGAKVLADEYCAMGAPLKFVTTLGDSHTSLAVGYWTKALAYMTQRFAGQPAPTSCAPVTATN